MAQLSTILLWTALFAVMDCAKYRVIYQNDNGYTCDPDNQQTLTHMLFFADLIDIRGIIGSGSTNCAHSAKKATDCIRDGLAAYRKDLPTLHQKFADLPTADELLSKVVDGVNKSSSEIGYPPPNAGSDLIVKEALADPETPLYLAVGAGLAEVARALHDHPEIKKNLRVWYVGSWNTEQDPHSRSYVYENHRDLWWIEANSTFRGVYSGGDQSGIYNDVTFVNKFLKNHTALGDYYSQQKDSMKEGDMPSVFYPWLKPNSSSLPSNPLIPHWGGRFVQQDSSRPTYYHDLDDGHKAAGTVSRWRVQYLDLWIERLKLFQ